MRDALSGKSVVDTRYATIRSLEEAQDTIFYYGYNWNRETDQRFLLDTHRRAVDFIQAVFLEPFDDNLKIPDEVRLCPDIRLLLQWTNLRARNKDLHMWACAVLKVMHTILHLENDFLYDYFQEARSQIFQRFHGHLYIDEKNMIYLGKDRNEFIPLYYFEVKREKDFHSKVLKLLHKPENTAVRIFDHIGVRIVTETLLDVLLVFQYLIASKIFIYANVTPSRTVNTLLEISQVQTFVSRILRRYRLGEMTREEAEHEIETRVQREELLLQNQKGTDNPFSLSGFRSIQFTCRYLVRFPNPTYTQLYDLRQYLFVERASVHSIGELDQILKNTKREITFFFPFEIQLMDRETFNENQVGLGSHEEYKKAQLLVARKRVLGKILEPAPRQKR